MYGHLKFQKRISEGNQPQPIEAKLRDISTIIVNDQSMLHLFYFGLEAIGIAERCMATSSVYILS